MMLNHIVETDISTECDWKAQTDAQDASISHVYKKYDPIHCCENDDKPVNVSDLLRPANKTTAPYHPHLLSHAVSA